MGDKRITALLFRFYNSYRSFKNSKIRLLPKCMSFSHIFIGHRSGKTTVKLEPNQKLEEITWKDDSLWYLTRPMTDEDVAETHTFRQQTDFGVLEGTVTIVESKE